MADASGEKQLTMLQDLEGYVEAIRSLVKGHGHGQRNGPGHRKRKKSESQRIVCDNKECQENSDSLSTIYGYVKNIRKIIKDGKKDLLQPWSSSPHEIENVSFDFRSPCEKALGNSLVLHNIMKHLDAPNLLCSRLVAKKWETEATSQLLSPYREKDLCNSMHQVEFEWNSYQQQLIKKDVGSLQEFSQSYFNNPCRKFPCRQFSFVFNFFRDIKTNGEFTKVPADLSNFLTQHIQHIKSLCLRINTNSPSALQVLRKIIFELSPSIKFLTLDFPLYGKSRLGDFEVTPDYSSEDGPKLPGLQELYLGQFNQMSYDCPKVLHRVKVFVEDILSSAPNLNLISVPYLWFTEEIVSSGKIRAVHSLSSKGNHIMTHGFETFAAAHPKLKELQLNLLKSYPSRTSRPPRDFLQNFLLILESSRRTLKTLQLTGRLDWDMSLEDEEEDLEHFPRDIPTLKNLEQLSLERWSSFDGGRGRILPAEFSVYESFPKLKSLNFQGLRNRTKNLSAVEEKRDNPFASDSNSSTTVERLRIEPDGKSFFHVGWLRQALFLYPNVRTLHLCIHNDWNELPKICRFIWKSWNESLLEELHVTVKCADEEIDSRFAEQMDQVLTGFDRKICRMLRKRGCQGDDEEFKRGHSILDMKKLRLFQLTDGEALSGFPIFSRVSVIHAFDPMKKGQNLRVVVNETELEEMVQERNVDFWIHSDLYD